MERPTRLPRSNRAFNCVSMTRLETPTIVATSAKEYATRGKVGRLRCRLSEIVLASCANSSVCFDSSMVAPLLGPCCKHGSNYRYGLKRIKYLIAAKHTKPPTNDWNDSPSGDLAAQAIAAANHRTA